MPGCRSRSRASIRALLRRCLERNPKNRLRDIGDARLALDDALAGRAEAATAGPSTAVAPTGSRRRELVAWGVAAVATVTAAAALFVGLRRAPAEREVATSPGSVRFAVLLEDGGEVQSYPALSPDGRTLAYVLQEESGAPHLVAHSFASGTGRALAGTDGAEQPFFSPDGERVGFFAGGQLKRLDLESGLVQTVAPVADPRGGAWTSEGDFVVSVNAASSIVRISAKSGELRAATVLSTEKGEQSHRYPSALPGGGFLYSSKGADAIKGIYWSDGGTSPPRRLVPDGGRAAYDPRGYLVWVRGGVLVAQRLDAATGELTGEPISIAEPIGTELQKDFEDWFAVGGAGSIAFRRPVGGLTELVWLDRSGALLSAITRPARFQEPSLSPDSRQVVIGVQDEGGTALWIYDTSALDRGRRLTFGADDTDTAVWSPDGRWVGYSSPREGGYKILRKAADGSGEEEVLLDSGPGSWVDSWAPDSASLLFERFIPERGADLWLLPLAGERKPVPFLETAANETHSAFSPDGRLVAYVSDESGIAEIYVRSVAPGSRWLVSRGGADWPAWSADGKELYFAGLDRTLYAVPLASLSPFSFGAPEPLFRLRTARPSITSLRTFFGVSADRRRVLVNQQVAQESADRIDVVTNWSPSAEKP